ncbi:MAG: hypothetical protein ACREJ2_09000 [Planctomycetota bacterium]
MTTLGQVLANRENAQQSTGPKTEAGKAAAAANRVSHGLTALKFLAKAEAAGAFATFQAACLEELAPQTVLQMELAERIAGLIWKVRRAESLETALWDSGGGSLEDMAVMLGTHARELALLMRYAQQNSRQLAAAQAQYRQMQAEARRQQEEIAQRAAAEEQALAQTLRQREEDQWSCQMADINAIAAGCAAYRAVLNQGGTNQEALAADMRTCKERYGTELLRFRKLTGRPVGQLMEAGFLEAERARLLAEKAEKPAQAEA